MSNPTGLSCGATCSYDFIQDSTTTLTATPDAGSLFAGWTGDCSGTGSCSLVMNSDKKVTATITFTSCSTLPVRINKPGGTYYYSSVQKAYDDAVSGDVIHCLAMDFAEDLIANRDIAITLAGGYDCGFNSVVDYTGLLGITTNAGVLTVSDVETVSAIPDGISTLMSSAGPGGSISPAGTVNVYRGTSQVYTITANTGYQLADVIVDNISKGMITSYTLTGINANHTIQAIFAQPCWDAATRCNDNNACTTDTCDAATGACGHTAVVCNDNNNCTIDTCNTATGCVFTTKNCDDGNICTTDLCVSIIPGGCVNAPNTLSCDDNNACTTGDKCSNKVCAGTQKNCNDNNACTIDSCDTVSGNCVRTISPTPSCISCAGQPNGSVCTDNNACTAGDACLDGACVGTTMTCNDNNACTADTCDPLNGCVITINNTLPCSDKNSCTDGDYCLNGACKSGVVRNCDDGNICTDDKMVPIIAACCVHVSNTKSCNDNNACTSSDKCANSVCAGTAKTCEDYDSCTTNSCDPASGSCVYTPVPDCICTGKPDGSPCTDGNACTVDSCVNQVCVSTPRTCNDNNVCTTDTCNTSTGCVFTNNTLSCSDNNTCTVGDVCLNGVCKPGATTNCDDGNICTTDTSVPVLPGCCVHAANTLSCSDNNACTTGDVCNNKVCTGTPVTCTPPLTCDPATGTCQ
ncbi:MAG: hypothetical protein M0R70_12485 [Nitrospirae bacterium]|nr:hypothetical protein [Nitrospirota bacterium]